MLIGKIRSKSLKSKFCLWFRVSVSLMIKEDLFNDIKGFVQRSFQKNKSAMLEYKLGLPGTRSSMDAELQG